MIKSLVENLLLLTKGKDEQEKQEIIKEFLNLLKEKNKLYLLPVILKELKKAEKKAKAELILAREFKQEFLGSLKKEIEKLLGEKEIEVIIEPEIIGGFLAKDENYLVDGSIKGNLNKFKQRVYGYL
jgi:F-type H+-transporting ATPase subunit delta